MGYSKIIFLAFLLPFFSFAGSVIYVDTSKAGTTKAQAADSATALTSLAKLNAIASSISAGDTIKFKSGQTFFGQLVVGVTGNSTNKITYTTYGGTAKAIITSMVTINNWQTTGRANIWISHTNIGISAATMVVNVNTGTPLGMGRWPNYVLNNPSLTDGSDGGFAHYTSSSTGTKIFQVTTELSGSGKLGNPPDPTKTDLNGATLWFKPEQFWEQTGTISDWDNTNHVLTYALKSVSSDQPNTAASGQWGYFIQDDSSLLDSPNEWFYNKTSKKIEIYSNTFPPPIQVATVTDLVTCRGKNWIVFENLEFNGAIQDVMHFGTGNDVLVNNCNVFNGGRDNILDSTLRLTVTNSNVINGNSRNFSLAPGGEYATIRFNVIRNGGVLSGMGTSTIEGGHGAYSGDNIYMYGNVDGMVVEYNKISNAGYANVHKNKGNDVYIRHNFMDSACILLADGGNMYSYNGSYLDSNGNKCSSGCGGATDTLYTQSYIVGNVITHPIGNQSGTSAGSAAGVGVAGIYNDKGSCCTIEDSNHVVGGEKALFISYGSTNIKARNNLIFDGTRQLQLNTRSSTKTVTYTRSNGTTYTKTYTGVDRSLLNTVANNMLIARKNTEKVVWMESINAVSLLKQIGKVDSNYLFRPVISGTITSTTIDSLQLIHYLASDASSDDITIKEDQTRFGFELHGVKAPTPYATQTMYDTSTLIVFNPEFTNQTVSLPNKYDVYPSGVHLNTGSVLLKPTQWLYLIRTGELDPTIVVNPTNGPIIINRLNGHKVGP